MMEERRNLEKDCEELEAALRKAFMLTLENVHREQKKREAALWQAAWVDWNASAADNSASSRMG